MSLLFSILGICMRILTRVIICAGTRSKIAVVTSQVSKISNASLNFVDRFGMQKQSVHLQTCSKVLFSSQVDLPEGSFILHLAGYDSHGNYFTYNTRINVTATSPSYMLNNSGPSNITLKEGSIAGIKLFFVHLTFATTNSTLLLLHCLN